MDNLPLNMSVADVIKYAQKMIDQKQKNIDLREKKTEYMRKYREDNREKFRQYNRKNCLAYYHKHKQLKNDKPVDKPQ